MFTIIYQDYCSVREQACTPGCFGCNQEPQNCQFFTKRDSLPVEPESWTGMRAKEWKINC